jgi:cytoskeletal protein CcmA (bactofilin family)
MSIFGRESESDSMSAMNTSTTTQVARGSKIVGEITGSAELRIDGEVEGKLTLEGSVIIGESGRVRGEIDAREVQVGGKMIGNVIARESVSILANGSVEGDVISPRMSLADGAFFKGRVEMGSGAAGAQQGSRP